MPITSYHVPVYEKYKKQRGLFPDVSLVEMYDQSDLYLVNNDVALEFPAPLSPKVIPIGGISAKPAKPLEQVGANPDSEYFSKNGKEMS